MGRLFGVLFMMFLLVSSCSDDKHAYPFKHLSYEDLRPLKKSDYIVSKQKLDFYIDSFRLSERDTNYVDIVTNRYYAERRPYLWISRWGISKQADTLLQKFAEARKAGLPEQRFFFYRLSENLHRMKERDFDNRHTVSRTLAALEYYLTKSYLRYCSGQRFGFVNPNKLFNHLEQIGDDTLRIRYRTLFGMPIDAVDKKFLSQAFKSIRDGCVNQFLNDVRPKNTLYESFYEELQHRNLTNSQRRILSINLERSRWRMKLAQEGRFVWVNLPAQQLQAFEKNQQKLSMKICLGSLKNKTPILSGTIKYMDLNPYWIVPKSIVRKDIIAHIGDTAYFARKHFKILSRKTGFVISPLEVTEEMLLGDDYIVRQENGNINSLGKIIFRFPNPYSIYLHDSNNKEAFNRSLRTVSHGCIRLEHPYELAEFLLNNGKEKETEYIRSALEDTSIDENEKEGTKRKVQRRCLVDPAVPLFIVYYTAFPCATNGRMQYYPDIYDYDDLIWHHLNVK